MSTQALKQEESKVGDPRKMFVSFLIRLISETTDLLYSSSPGARRSSMTVMQAIIAVLDSGSKKKLESTTNKLTEMETIGNYQLKDIRDTFNELLNFLHTTYLQEVNYARALNPNPKPIGEEQNEQQSKMSTV